MYSNCKDIQHSVWLTSCIQDFQASKTFDVRAICSELFSFPVYFRSSVLFSIRYDLIISFLNFLYFRDRTGKVC